MTYDPEARPTIAEIDGRALARNFREIVELAGGRVGVLPVLKSNAYGHGLLDVARILMDAGAERFAVATAAEGAELRAAGHRGAIVILGGVYRAEYRRVIDERLTPVLWDVAAATELAAIARDQGRSVPIHVKVDTGMSRLGVLPESALELFRALRTVDGLVVEGVLTHFCSAERVGGPETARQLESFRHLIGALESGGLRPPIVHAANSAATLAAPQAHFDWVRPGLALYGVHPSSATRSAATLAPVMRLVTRVIALREIPAGTGVSYGATFVTKRRSRIATVPVGYADGYPRALSNRGVMMVRGVRAPIAGRVCMDQTMIDVTEVAGAAIGDEVELWGSALPVEDVAERADTIPYELLARVGSRVPRIAV